MCTKTVVEQKVGDRFAHFVRTVALALVSTKKTAPLPERQKGGVLFDRIRNAT